MEQAKKLLRTFLGIPITILAFIFIGKIFFDNKSTIFEALTTMNVTYFILGIFFFTLFFALKSLIWINILKIRGHKLPVRKTIFAYNLSEVKRYIPGSIFAFWGRMHSLSDTIPKRETLRGIGIEAILLASSALVFSIPALLFIVNKYLHIPHLLIFTLITIILLLVILAAYIFKLHKNAFQYFDSYLLFLSAWLFYGLGCIFTTLSITSFYPNSFMLILSGFVLSWLAGYLFFITPMGLGVREIVVTLILSLSVPTQIATLVAILSRLGMTLGELAFLLLSYAATKTKRNSSIQRLNIPLAIVLFLAFVYTCYFTYFTFLKHSTFNTGRFDLGNMSQTVWNTAHGRIFMLTNPDGTENLSRLAVHSDFILILFAPFYLLWSDPRMLLLIQTIILAIGGIYLYFLARHILKSERIAVVLSLSYFGNFWLQEQNIFDFHAVSLSTTFFIAALYYLINKKYLLLTLFLLLAALTKENILLIISFFGLYFVFKEKKKVIGLMLTILPFIAFYLLGSVAIPAARGNAHFVLEHYSYLGGSLGEIILNIITRPYLLFGHIFNSSTLQYFNHHLLPTGYLALLSPQYLLFALPEVAIYLLSGNFEYRSYHYHFGAAILPFVFLSTIYTIRKLKNKFKINDAFISYYLLGSLFLSIYLYSPIPGMRESDYSPYYSQNSQRIASYLSIIPPNASVSSSNNVGAHLSHREHIYVVPHGAAKADFLVLYKEKPKIISLLDLQAYDLLIKDEKNNFYLYKKKFNTPCTNCQP